MFQYQQQQPVLQQQTHFTGNNQQQYMQQRQQSFQQQTPQFQQNMGQFQRNPVHNTLPQQQMYTQQPAQTTQYQQPSNVSMNNVGASSNQGGQQTACIKTYIIYYLPNHQRSLQLLNMIQDFKDHFWLQDVRVIPMEKLSDVMKNVLRNEQSLPVVAKNMTREVFRGDAAFMEINKFIAQIRGPAANQTGGGGGSASTDIQRPIGFQATAAGSGGNVSMLDPSRPADEFGIAFDTSSAAGGGKMFGKKLQDIGGDDQLAFIPGGDALNAQIIGDRKADSRVLSEYMERRKNTAPAHLLQPAATQPMNTPGMAGPSNNSAMSMPPNVNIQQIHQNQIVDHGRQQQSSFPRISGREPYNPALQTQPQQPSYPTGYGGQQGYMQQRQPQQQPQYQFQNPASMMRQQQQPTMQARPQQQPVLQNQMVDQVRQQRPF